MLLWPVAFTVIQTGCSGSGRHTEIQAGALRLQLDTGGWVVSLEDRRTGAQYLPRGHASPFLTLRSSGVDLAPLQAEFPEGDSLLVLTYRGGFEALVGVRTRDTHATFELLAVSKPDSVDLAIWGPYPTTISETIGETVGVVRGRDFAVGLQALNPKTLGGYPWNENDAMPQLDIFESGDYSDLSEEGKRYVLYRVEAAKPDSFGSTLQAYTRNRFRERIIPNWGYDRYVAPAFEDGGVIGSKIALFGSPVEDALATVGAIEVAEGLPHPTIDGVWGKEARSASAAYVIMPFSESTVGDAVDVTLRAGLRYLYHPEPFRTWGHFELGDDFPDGVAGLRRAVEAAGARGVYVGAHTLSNFLTTNDPYVTPVPDPRLARVGATVLTEAVEADAREMGIEHPGFFSEIESSHLQAALIGEEIIRYRAVSAGTPWRLLEVERGAFGTRPERHEAGAEIAKLADHAYRVFLTDAELGMEVASNLARLFNATGLRQISFDGLEGNRSTGMGNYGEILFTTTWYDALSDDVRRHFIADASRTSHYFWHIYSRMNWGEPWYAGFRESQTEYRLKNQAYFRRNMMPGMLGWFRMQPETTVEDIEWMLARSAAFDAGYGLVTSFDALEENGRSEEILSLVGRWERARMADAFSPDQKRRMEDVGREFHLEEDGEDGWRLREVHPVIFRFRERERQPGEPRQEVFTFTNPVGEQGLHLVLTAEGGSAEGIRLELDGPPGFGFPVRLREGESLVIRGGGVATHYSPRWKELGEVVLEAGPLRVTEGEHRLLLDAALAAGEEVALRVELRLSGEPEPLPGR